MTRILAALLSAALLASCAARLPDGVRVASGPTATSALTSNSLAGPWRHYVDAKRAFAIDSPGRFVIDVAAPAVADWQRSTYVVRAGTLTFSVTAVERHPDDRRKIADLIGKNGLALEDWAWVHSTDGSLVFQREYRADGRLQRHRVVLAGRMIYELHVAGPADVYPEFAAQRFFGSFSLLLKT